MFNAKLYNLNVDMYNTYAILSKLSAIIRIIARRPKGGI